MKSCALRAGSLSPICLESECAFWDESANRCSILSMAKSQQAIATGVEYLNNTLREILGVLRGRL